MEPQRREDARIGQGSRAPRSTSPLERHALPGDTHRKAGSPATHEGPASGAGPSDTKNLHDPVIWDAWVYAQNAHSLARVAEMWDKCTKVPHGS